MRIAIFDYQVTTTNPVGSCHRKLVEKLSNEHEFTVFAVQFDNPAIQAVKWVKVPVPRRPLALLFIAYHLVAPICYFVYRLRTGHRFDVVQKVESNLLLGNVCYSHFCHRVFLREHWGEIAERSLRSWFRWLDHKLHAMLERWAYSRADSVVVPSRGLGRELDREFAVADKTTIIYNPVDTSAFRRAADFDSQETKASLGFTEVDIVLTFVALGHFERKGLPLILSAMGSMRERNLKLIVVGGTSDLVASYKRLCAEHGLADAVRFTGSVDDVRPFLWIADAFVFPSLYEAFSLVCFQAAAAGVTPITARLHGVEEFLVDGETGILVDRRPESVREGIDRFTKLHPAQRKALAQAAQDAVQAYDESRFVTTWRSFYDSVATAATQATDAAHSA